MNVMFFLLVLLIGINIVVILSFVEVLKKIKANSNELMNNMGIFQYSIENLINTVDKMNTSIVTYKLPKRKKVSK